MHASPETTLAAQQTAFAARIRDPHHAPRPNDVPAERMAVYQELFYNNIHGVLSDAFPVLRSLHDEGQWHALCRDFFAHHRCQTPLFNQVAAEFIDYLSTRDDQPPYILELAHYEWLELELAINEAELPPTRPELNARLRISPLARAVAYDYPVHTIGPGNIPGEPEPVQLLVYRDRDDRIGFLQLNPVSARLVQLIEQGEEDVLTRIAEELNHPNPETVIRGGNELLRDLIARDILI